MTPFKCKLCGGDIIAETGQPFGKCDSCGTTTTLPKASDEQKVNLHNRANHFRRKSDFDQAVKAYEIILNIDDTDAEAHWGLVLSKYGIDYVEDPVTHSLVPTCHRLHSESILSDIDYQAALGNTPDGYTRSLYEEEAKRISEIQKKILAISSMEKPYDIFICYKETTDGGTRTKDSALAQEVYYQLVNEGYNVFFSRITLESKLGQEYEPYIFAALNSAKVMLVIGTKPEYFNAVWVKNEWSRFLALMKGDRNRLLIPCYQEMDPYDIPSELSMLQCQDMSKIGFVQDLVRGIKKVLDKSGAGQAAAAGAQTIAPQGPSQTDALLKRAFIVLGDEDWQKADQLLENVLNLDPENSRAYIGKLMVQLQAQEESMIPAKAALMEIKSLSEFSDYEKALRFADAEYRGVLEGFEPKRKEILYQESLVKMESATSSKQFDFLANRLDSISEYKDSFALAVRCRDEANRKKQVEDKYNKSCVMKARLDEEGDAYFFWIIRTFRWNRLASEFESLRGYKKADNLAKQCRSHAKTTCVKQFALIGLITLAFYLYYLRYCSDSDKGKNDIEPRSENIQKVQTSKTKPLLSVPFL